MEKQKYQWTDATTYSRGQTDKTPTAWQYTTPDLWIWISNGHRHHPNEWVVTCHALAMDAVVMRAAIDTPLADVQAMAIRIVKRRLSNMLTNIAGKSIAEVVACVNHDAVAIKSHAQNFPNCVHHTEDVRTLDVSKLPRKLPGDRRVWILWASLECTHFSNAKTGARDADSRTLAHALFPYIEHINPDLVQIENVREFMSWGELDDRGRPIKRKNGIHYVQWRQQVEAMGYRYKSKLLNSADFGAYQARTWYFAVFAKPEMPIIFPEPTHEKNGKNGLPKWNANRVTFSKPHAPTFDFKTDGLAQMIKHHLSQ